MSLALDYAPARLARPRQLGWPGLVILGVTAAAMLELPVRQVVAFAQTDFNSPNFLGVHWQSFWDRSSLSWEREQLWARVSIALFVMMTFTLWNGLMRRRPKTSVAVSLAGAAIILIGMYCPLPVASMWLNTGPG
jgi:hypothetical protein